MIGVNFRRYGGLGDLNQEKTKWFTSRRHCIQNNHMKPITRRNMLSKASWLGTAVAVGLPLVSTAAEELPGQISAATKPRLKVVVTGGHPGDPEYGCGGTIALCSDLGYEVVLLYLNKGEWSDKPSYDPSPVRVAEATKACEILKARPAFAGQIDGKAIVDNAHYEQFHRLMEAEQPNVVFTQWPIDNHPDHRALSLLTYGAWQRMGKKFALYYYEVSNGEDTVQFAPTHYVDITSAESRKRSACYAPDKFFELQELVTRMRGIESGHKQAEGYIHHVQSPAFALPLASG
jgi:LmbE family N-acetylglucosaminyl deacetylase